MHKYKYLLGLFLTSLTLFFYELLVSRLFSVLLSNQYSYLVISFAILGLGIGGILVYYLDKKGKFTLYIFTICYIITYLGIITIIFLSTYLGSPVWYILLGMLPFIFGGGIISHLFKIQPNTYQVYFVDLIGGDNWVGNCHVINELSRHYSGYNYFVLTCVNNTCCFKL